MSKASIAYSNLQYENYGNWYLKAYEPDTNNAKVIYSSADDATGFDKVQLDSEGFPQSAGVKFVPFIETYFDLWLFSTEDEADENITTNAVKLASNITAQSSISNIATADYSNVGTAQILSESKINQTYDAIEGGGLVFLPEVYETPNFLTNRTQISRELQLLGIDGGGGLEIGDGFITNRNLDSNINYVQEGTYFDRLQYSEFDAILGDFIPEDTDFSSSSFSVNYIDETEITYPPNTNPLTGRLASDSSYYIKSTGILSDTTIFKVRFNFLYIIRKSDMVVLEKIPAPAGLAFQDAILNTSNELILCLTSIFSASEPVGGWLLHMYKLNITNDGIDLMAQADYNFNSTVSIITDQLHLIQSVDSGDYFVVSTDSSTLTSNSGDNFIDIVYFKNDFTEDSINIYKNLNTLQTFNGFYYDNFSANGGLIPFYNPNYNSIDIIITARTTGGGTENDAEKDRICRIPESYINKGNGNVNPEFLPDEFFHSFNSVPTILLDPGMTRLSFSGVVHSCYVDFKNDFLWCFGDYSQASGDGSGLIDPSAEHFFLMIYSLRNFGSIAYFRKSDFPISFDEILPDTATDGTKSRNKMKSFDQFKFGSNNYLPITSTDGLNSRKIHFVKLGFDFDTRTDELVFLDNTIAYTAIGNGVTYYSNLNRYIYTDKTNNIFITDSRGADGTNNSSLSIFKLELDGGAITDLKRIAPEISVLGTSKGYWKAL